MARHAWNVGDREARESFLREGLPECLDSLRPETPARWGSMRPQEMVEHLQWAFECSTGEAQVECRLPPNRLEQARAFLASDRQNPREFMNPVLVGGLPPLRYADLANARGQLLRGVERFLDGAATVEKLFTHPVFGAIGHEDWHRSHYKHVYHHLLQFGLLEE